MDERLKYERCIQDVIDRKEQQRRVTKIKYCSARMHSHRKHVEKRRKRNKIVGES